MWHENPTCSWDLGGKGGFNCWVASSLAHKKYPNFAGYSWSVVWILQTRKVHRHVAYFNMLTFRSFQIHRRTHSTNQGIIWVQTMSSKLGTHLMCTYMCTMVKTPDFGDGHCVIPLPFALGNPSVNHLFLNGPSHIGNTKTRRTVYLLATRTKSAEMLEYTFANSGLFEHGGCPKTLEPC